MPDDLVCLPIMCDSVNASAKAVGSRNLLIINVFSHLDRLVIKEEVRRPLAILCGHQIV